MSGGLRGSDRRGRNLRAVFDRWQPDSPAGTPSGVRSPVSGGELRSARLFPHSVGSFLLLVCTRKRTGSPPTPSALAAAPFQARSRESAAGALAAEF